MPKLQQPPEPSVAFDLACHGCAYNLRGLPRNGRCPECGAPVEVALAGDALRYADPAWVSRIAKGAGWNFWAVTRFGWGVICWLAIRLLVPAISVGLLVVLLGLGMALVFGGPWMIASPNPALVDKEGRCSPRRLVRWSVGAAWLGLAGLTGMLLSPGSPKLAYILLLIAPPVGVGGLIGGLAQAAYLRHIAVLIGDTESARRIRGYSFLFAVGWFVFTPGWLAMVGPGVWGFCLFIPGSLMILAGGALILLSPSYLTKRLQEHSRWAAETWGQALRQAGDSVIATPRCEMANPAHPTLKD